MKNKTFLCCIIAVFPGLFFGSGVFGFSLDDLTGAKLASALIAGEKPVQAQFNNPRPQLAPQNGVLREFIEAVRQDLEPSVMVETLHIYTKPPAAGKDAWSSQEEVNLYNGILALSTLKGLQYYSRSHGAMRTLYETSSVIDGPSGNMPLPDPVYSEPPAELTVFARQKDSSFGDNVYQYDYHTAPGALIFIQKNLTSLTYGIIPAIRKNNLRSVFAVFDAGNYLLVYAVSMAKAASVPGMNSRVGDSFANRANAIFNWFSDQADDAFRKAGNSPAN